jgi:hypothetical protein
MRSYNALSRNCQEFVVQVIRRIRVDKDVSSDSDEGSLPIPSTPGSCAGGLGRLPRTLLLDRWGLVYRLDWALITVGACSRGVLG